jgi:hypothetical protein
MREVLKEIPAMIPEDFNWHEVIATIATHFPDVEKNLQWIVTEKIDGIAFQTLNHSVLQELGMQKFGDRARILHLQKASQPAMRTPPKDMLKIFAVLLSQNSILRSFSERVWKWTCSDRVSSTSQKWPSSCFRRTCSKNQGQKEA